MWHLAAMRGARGDHGSVAGLRFARSEFPGASAAPLETRSGSYIYDGGASSYHDWEFRTPSPAGSKKSKSVISKTAKDKDDIDADILRMRSELVHRILEVLRGDAFMVARDLGMDNLTHENGIRNLIDAIKKVVFPRASEEARELFHVGQRSNGPLSRQFGEAVGSYVSRRRRWWSTLRELDPSIQLSESMLTELLLDGAGIAQQEILVIRACAGTSRSFEGVASILVEHYSGVTMKDARTLSAQSNPANQQYRPRTGKGQGYSSGSGKGRTGYSAAIAEDEEEWLIVEETMGPRLCGK